jgi:uncharacterized membrane protein HdeD (DUF308 family)
MEKLKKFISGMVPSLLEVFVGVLLLVDPNSFTSGIIMVLGAVLLFAGLVCVFKYFRAEPAEAMVSQNLFKGLMALVAGSFCIFANAYIVSAFAVLTLVYGIVILITGLSKLQKIVDAWRLKKTGWAINAVSAVIALGCAAIIIFNPFTTTEWVWRFIGITLVVEALVDAIAVVFGGKDKQPADEEQEAPVIEESEPELLEEAKEDEGNE